MSKHTAGPWEWNHDDQLVAVNVMTPSFEDLDTDEDERKPVVIIETDGGHYPPRGYDRLLLAAAPDLLAALQAATEVLEILRRGHGVEVSGAGYPALNDCRDAIAKATGSAS